MEITRIEMKGILRNVNNPEMISFTSLTNVDMNQYLDYWLVGENGKKTKNPNPTRNPFFDLGIKKLQRKYKVITGFDYEKSVNRRLEKEGKEGNFESEENWFEPISKGLVTDKRTETKFYLRYQVQPDSVIGEPEYTYNGNPIMKEFFQSFLKTKNNFYDKQGLDNPLMFQVCDLNNILTISMGGEKYELVGSTDWL